mmetsp:Transcript_25346/g.45896  ORF Transcript_25346/g.45896 Transcript_25346/m.45896 type:complete len:252 (+) Transcript_25346:163-918(+)
MYVQRWAHNAKICNWTTASCSSALYTAYCTKAVLCVAANLCHQAPPQAHVVVCSSNGCSPLPWICVGGKCPCSGPASQMRIPDKLVIFFSPSGVLTKFMPSSSQVSGTYRTLYLAIASPWGFTKGSPRWNKKRVCMIASPGCKAGHFFIASSLAWHSGLSFSISHVCGTGPAWRMTARCGRNSARCEPGAYAKPPPAPSSTVSKATQTFTPGPGPSRFEGQKKASSTCQPQPFFPGAREKKPSRNTRKGLP